MSIDLAAACDDVGRAKALLASLKTNTRRRRVLLILDLWKDFTLEMIGIPKPSSENGLKLVIICRTLLSGSSIVAKYGNEVDNHEIKSLSEAETIVMFAEIFEYEKFRKIPEETWRMLLEECDCLPLVIVNLANSIKKWLKKNLTGKEISKSIKMEVDCFKFPHDSLEDNYWSLREETRPYFFFCALYPSQPNMNDLIETEDLIRYWICDGLMGHNVELDHMNAMMERCKEILEEMKNAYLLEIVSQDEGKTQCVKMRKSVRKMAAQISTNDFFIEVGDAKKPNRVVAWKEVERASVMSNQLDELGREPKTRLSTLLVRNHRDHEYNLTSLARLFPEMPNVKVLDLSGTRVESFPISFINLKKLRALRLRNCIHLRSLPDVSSFLELLVLDLSATRIRSLPSGLKLLKKLLRLDISHTYRLIRFPFPDGLLTALTGLRELLMMSSYLWTGQENAQDLKRLTELARLETNFSNLQALRSFVGSADPESGAWPSKFKLCVGKFYLHQKLDRNSLVVIGDQDQQSMVSLPSDNTLYLMFNKNYLEVLPFQDNTNLRFLTVINVSDCGGLVYLLKSTMLHSVPNLQRIVVKRCEKMVALIKEFEAADAYDEVCLGNLEELVLSQLEQLVRICHGNVRCEHLKSISVWQCDRLEKVPCIVGRRENNRTVLKGDKSWFDLVRKSFPSNNFEEMYTTSDLIEDTIPTKELFSKLTYTDLNDVTRTWPSDDGEDNTSFVRIMIFILCYVAIIIVLYSFTRDYS